MGIEELLLDRAEKKGEHQKALEIARELKKENLTSSFIAKATKLAIEKIEKL
ncbi:hypothetical protein [Mucilaginibacter sp. FT3.2]|uniref:hypothetical protein n=1 Tax=Mucilaginibacter sp. FT3.2 TaxID=2723090 RepID=UPI001614488B|nr:hypothetical protein [Mucilaginibacter sp. FT3.2]MBB6235023.1 hypothetical protein [Mucilaginibacter sp. FT3.2]